MIGVLSRRAVVTALGALLVAPLRAQAQPARKPAKVAVLAGGGPGFDDGFGAFRERLRDFGYIEAQSVVFLVRNAQGRDDRYAEVAREVVAFGPDVIVVQGNAALVALQKATREIPIVMASIGDPVGAGFVASLARPGGNITGLSNMSEGVAPKWLELVKEVTPKAARIGVLRDPRNAAHASMLAEIQRAARTIGVAPQVLDGSSANEIESVVAAAHRDIAAIIFLPQPAVGVNPGVIVGLVAKYKLPAVYFNRSFADAGGLLSYGPSFSDLWRGAAEFVDKILKGARPADLPVVQPTRFELAVNLKAAHALGLTVPPAMLLRADHVIK